jgi:hypothetical protein
VNGAETGTCEPTGYCSFADPTCPASRRYSDWAGELAGQCVGGAGADGGMNGADSGPNPTPDADDRSDAGPRVLVRFGERLGADVSGVARETEILDNQPSTNFGGDSNFGCDRYESTEELTQNALLRFDITALPAGATVVTAEIVLVNLPNNMTADGVKVYALAEDWSENSATWYSRVSGTAWAVPGAEGSPSRQESHAAEFFPTTADAEYAVQLPQGLVQLWVDDSSTNHGVVLVCNSADGVSWHSSEAGIASSVRPEMRVVYEP